MSFCSPWMEWGHDGSPPVQCDGQHGEHRGGHRAQGDKLVHGAVELTIMPVPAAKECKLYVKCVKWIDTLE